MSNIAIIGSEGAIGLALTKVYLNRPEIDHIYLFARRKPLLEVNGKCSFCPIDLKDEESIKVASAIVKHPLNIVVITTGLLHSLNNQGLQIKPEKSLRDLGLEQFHEIFAINTFGPALVMRYFIPLLDKVNSSVLAALSARVGSISDNRLGGWYSYRSSKAALNMIVKCASIETQRTNPNAAIIGYHPGTVISKLSEPFTQNTPSDKLFTPEFAATKLANVLDKISVSQTGKCLDYDGQIIES